MGLDSKSLAVIVERLTRSGLLSPPSPARVDEIASAEKRLGRTLPADLRQFYESTSGMLGPNEPALVWIWPVDRLELMSESLPKDARALPELTNTIVFADYSIWVHGFAMNDAGEIFMVGHGYHRIARNIADFLEMVDRDDERLAG